MVLDDWCQCYECKFPALYSVFSLALSTDNGTSPCLVVWLSGCLIV